MKSFAGLLATSFGISRTLHRKGRSQSLKLMKTFLTVSVFAAVAAITFHAAAQTPPPPPPPPPAAATTPALPPPPGVATSPAAPGAVASPAAPGVMPRSEEHTSELQSPYDLVCRLLLEKKKTNQTTTHPSTCNFTKT